MCFLIGCRESNRSTEPFDAAPAPNDAGRGNALPSDAAASASDAGGTSSPTVTPTKVTTDGMSAVRTLVATASGALVVWARDDGDSSEIVARAIDAKGAWIGKTRLLRRTSGSVAQVAAVVSGDDVWVGWGSSSKRVAFVALVRTDLALEHVSSPVTLVSTSGEGMSVGEHSIALASTRFGVAMAYPSGKARCKDDSGEMAPCLEFAVTSVDRAFAQKTLLKHALAVGPEISIDALVDVESGVALSAFGWRGGADVANFYLPYDGSGAKSLPQCRPPHQMHHVDGKLLLLCAGDFYAKGETCPLAKDNLCPRVSAIDLSSSAPPKLSIITRDHTRCAPKRTREIEWGGGKAMIVDPRPPFEIDSSGKPKPTRCP